MEKKKILFIYNPRAGKAKIRSNLLDIIDIFVKAGYEVTAYPTQSRGDGIKAVTERKTGYYDLIVCSGGDGTLDEVVTGMMQCERKIPIGYVPAGSTNDFANSLHIPRNMIDAAQVIVKGRNFACDIGTFNDDIFVYIAAFGIFTEVSYETSQDVKNVLGHMAYILEGMRRLASVKAYKIKVESRELSLEGVHIPACSPEGSVTASEKGKYVQLDDGEFEVTLIKMPNNPMELNLIMAALINRNINTDCMYCFKTSALRISSQEKIAWTLDGEFGGEHKFVEITNQKQALSIRIPG